MMNVDMTMGAPVCGAPSPDATCASAVPSEGAAAAFAALLDAATGNPAPRNTKDASDADASIVDLSRRSREAAEVDEIAAMAAASLLAIAPLVTPLSNAPSDGAAVTGTGDGNGQQPVDEATPQSIDAAVAEIPLDEAAIAAMATEAGNTASTAPTEPPSNAEITPEATPASAQTSSDPTAEAIAPAAKAAMQQEPITSEPAANVEAAPKADAAKAETPSPKAGEREGAATPKSKGAQSPHKDQKTARADRGVSAAPDVQRPPVDPARAGAPMSQLSQAVAAHAAEPQGSASTAARFARALERASAAIAHESKQGEIAAAADPGAMAQDGTQQEARGQSWPDAALQLVATSRVESPHSGAFTLAGVAPLDLRGTTAPVETIAQSSAAAPVQIPERDVVAQLVQSMRLQFRGGIGEAVVTLKPEHLGTVSISLRIENGTVSASVHAGVPEVRQWLESQQGLLRDSLAEQGLRLDRFVVEPDGKRESADDDSARGQSRRRRPQQRRPLSANEPVFEVLA